MRIFLSYASEEKTLAEPIAFSLRARGHSVFLDRDDLPAAKSHDAQVQKAIASSDLFIFLISPASVAQGCEALTELAYARRLWRHPAGRVVPVLTAPTDPAALPGFLKGVPLVEPKGNLTAEVGAAVEALRRSAGRIWRTTWRAAGVAVLVYVGIFASVIGAYVFFGDPFAGSSWASRVEQMIFSVLFALPMSVALYVFARNRSWTALLPFVLTAFFVTVGPAIDIQAMTEIDPEVLGLESGSAGYPEKRGTVITPPPAGPSDAQLKVLDQIAVANKVSALLNLFVMLLVVGAFINAAAFSGAAIAARELRSFSRWVVNWVVATPSFAVLFFPLAYILKHLDQGSALEALAAIAVFALWHAIMGGLVGYWLARGDPDETAQTR